MSQFKRFKYVFIGKDNSWEAYAAKNVQTDNYLNAATLTMRLYDALDVCVSGVDPVTLAYVAASDGAYLGVLQSTVSATLIAGAYYRVKADLVQGGIVDHSEWDVQAVYSGAQDGEWNEG
jgi:hypothetical protein